MTLTQTIDIILVVNTADSALSKLFDAIYLMSEFGRNRHFTLPISQEPLA